MYILIFFPDYKTIELFEFSFSWCVCVVWISFLWFIYKCSSDMTLFTGEDNINIGNKQHTSETSTSGVWGEKNVCKLTTNDRETISKKFSSQKSSPKKS